MYFHTASTLDKVASSSKLAKDDSLKTALKNLSENRHQIEDNFSQIGKFVKKTGSKTTKVGKSDKNMPCNRYQSVGEYFKPVSDTSNGHNIKYQPV